MTRVSRRSSLIIGGLAVAAVVVVNGLVAVVDGWNALSSHAWWVVLIVVLALLLAAALIVINTLLDEKAKLQHQLADLSVQLQAAISGGPAAAAKQQREERKQLINAIGTFIEQGVTLAKRAESKEGAFYDPSDLVLDEGWTCDVALWRDEVDVWLADNADNHAVELFNAPPQKGLSFNTTADNLPNKQLLEGVKASTKALVGIRNMRFPPLV